MTPISAFVQPRLAATLFLALLAALPAQERRRGGEDARAPGLRPDVTIFSPLDLPTPSRLRSASGAPGPDYWQQKVDYRIDVSLDPASRTIAGQEHVTYHNNSPETLTFVWVHLEQNILKKDSIGTLTGGGEAVGGPSEPSDGVTVRALTSDGKALAHSIYDTMMRVDLPQPLTPGGKFEFDCAWSFQVPTQVFRRFGTWDVKKGTVWEIAQWFPAIAVYDDVHGWNTLPYSGTGEFYNNFGNFELNITAPRNHIVVASGELQNAAEVFTKEQHDRLQLAKQSRDTVVIQSAEEVGQPGKRPAGDGPLTWRFQANNVRTVAFASSEAFVLDACSREGVLVQSAYPEESLPVWGKSTQMLATAIEGYNRRWFRYPYPVATNVGGVEGGMEYPMIIFCSGENSRNERGLYGVTTHEIGHNWFPMVVNTDERRHAWMDEGFNTFINRYSSADWFKKGGEAKPSSFASMMKMPGVPIVTAADRLNGLQLGLLQYQKTGVGLTILREYVLGEERFDYAFREYIRRWAFKSPQPADFFRTMENAAGMDLAWFWRGWFLEDALLDQAIDDVKQPGEKSPGRITFRNKDRMVMPMTYRITFEDDSTELVRLPVEAWFQSDVIKRTTPRGKKLKEVRIDPDAMLPDAARDNNVWTNEG